MIVPIETPVGLLALIAVAAYALGSVPFGIVMAHVFRLGDLRKIGSGNIGATNVLRTGHKLAALLTLLLDAGKGAIAVLIARALTGNEDAAQIAGLAAVLGHCFSLFLSFRGGKGVATILGTLVALHPLLGLAACLVWLLAAALGRRSSLAALIALGCAPVIALMLAPHLALICALLAGLAAYTHRANIARLCNGTEPKIGKSSN